MKTLFLTSVCALLIAGPEASGQTLRSRKFKATTVAEAVLWQKQAREKLFALTMGGKEPVRASLDPQVLQRTEMPAGGYTLEELTLQTRTDRRAHAWLARPSRPRGRVGAVVAIHGHGGSGEQIVRGLSLYGYGRALIEKGYVVIAPDVGQHELRHASWSLMGERTWDALRCIDYLVTLPDVDPNRIGVAGLSLGGETAMYVAALDERIKIACSSGWLTTVANMKNGHCSCFNFPGLEEHFDFSDIFACVAPRTLICEVGEKERAPGGFPVAIAEQAFAEIGTAYRVFNSMQSLTLTVHPAGHVFDGRDFWPKLQDVLGEPRP